MNMFLQVVQLSSLTQLTGMCLLIMDLLNPIMRIIFLLNPAIPIIIYYIFFHAYFISTKDSVKLGRFFQQTSPEIVLQRQL